MKNRSFPHRRSKRRLSPIGIGAIAVVVILCVVAVAYMTIAHPLANTARTHTSSATSAAKTANKTVASRTAASSAPLTPAQVAASHLPAVQVSLTDAEKPLWVHVQLSTQNVVVYDARNRVVAAFICSSGSPGNDTPTGTYTVKDRGESFYNPKYQEGAYNWVRFNGSYLFHSVPFDANHNIIPAQVTDLGEPSSHGCIHLSMDDSKWIYDNIPKGTKVVIE